MAEQFEGIFAKPDATAEDRQGVLSRSHAEFGELIDTLNKLLDKRSPAYQQLSSQQLMDWFERLRNSLDRDADGYLYGDHDYAKAAAGFEKCLKIVQENSEQFPRSNDVAATRYKLAIALASAPSPDVSKLQASMQAADQYGKSALCAEQQETIEIVRNVAHALAEWRQADGGQSLDTRTNKLVENLGAYFAPRVLRLREGAKVSLIRDERLAYFQLIAVVSGAAEGSKEFEALRDRIKKAAHDAADPPVENAAPMPVSQK